MPSTNNVDKAQREVRMGYFSVQMHQYGPPVGMNNEPTDMNKATDCA